MTQDQIALVVGGVALASVVGLIAGTNYAMRNPTAAPNSLVLGGLVFGTSATLGLVLQGSHPEVAKGLFWGGAGLALLSPLAASKGVFRIASLEYNTVKDTLFGPPKAALPLPSQSP